MVILNSVQSNKFTNYISKKWDKKKLLASI